ncbi:ABC transporter substrate-binding protein [Nakamurella leprariae]|uniref:ABC transporter substrate-binding protein n=1 Tax=Nakamurella leprariae TaxID=2803911 RepID=A0A938YFD8_9ACTN|nr:ABC transporter substrate-binding protein [Nakamurella leprariae]MBM9468568.1 ABC transporter substrate-binding protein [Nakamurella leprariae]
MKLPARLLRALAAVTAAGLLLSACGGGDSGSTGTSGSSASSSSGSTGTADRDTVNIAIDPLLTLDPGVARGASTDLTIMSQIYSSLTRFNADSELVGDLATDWEQTSPTEWTFTLVEGATFVDGAPLDANTVVWNMERMLDESNALPGATGIDKIESVTAPDATTVVITTSSPFVDLPRRLSWIYFLDPTWAEANNPATAANPSGVYDLVSWSTDGVVELVRNENYYGEPAPIQYANYRVYANAATKLAALQAGELDAVATVAPIDVPQLESSGNITVIPVVSSGHHIIRFNLDHEATADVRVRQAINYAIDKQAITESLYQGLVEPLSTQLMGPGFSGYDEDRESWPYDPERARELLADAGYGNGLALEMAVPEVSNFVSASEASQIIAAQLSEVGITLKTQTIPGNIWAEYQRTKDTAPDMIYQGFGSSSISSTELLNFVQSAGIYTWGQVPAALDQAVIALQDAPDEATQLELIAEVTEILYDKALAVYLWPRPQVNAVANGLNWPGRADTYIRAYEMSWTA